MMNVSITAAAAEFLAIRPKHAEDSPWLMATLIMVVSTVYIYRQALALEKRQHGMQAAAVATLEHEKRHAPAAGTCSERATRGLRWLGARVHSGPRRRRRRRWRPCPGLLPRGLPE